MLACVQAGSVEFLGKMAGAVGNYNAHLAAYGGVPWDGVAREFVASLGLAWNPCVTQARLTLLASLCCCLHPLLCTPPAG